MYNPAHFREDRPEILYELIRLHPLGTLITEGPEVSHVPFVLDTGRGALRCHLAKANPHTRTLASAPEVLVVFLGANHYVTPSWYPSKQEHGRVVPTWNYTAVHVRGRARILDSDTELLQHLNELTNTAEASFEVPWRVGDAPERFIAGLKESILGLEIAIGSLEGKFKLSQNRSAQDREGVIAGLQGLHTAASLEMAELMKRRRPG
jgi:transcriptional regulator